MITKLPVKRSYRKVRFRFRNDEGTLWRKVVALVCVTALVLVSPRQASGYSVMSHQAIIDAAWENDIKPALERRFPNLTDDDFKKAHAYAYGGAIIQDLGYYPYGN